MRIRPAGAVAMLLAIALASIGPVPAVFAADNIILLDPATVTVAKDATFKVTVTVNATVAVSGAQAAVEFDKTKLTLTAVEKGAGFKDAPLFIPSDLKKAATDANKSGRLEKVAAGYLPPANVKAGNAAFLILTFKAIGTGTVAIKLPTGPNNAELLDGRDGANYGKSLKVVTQGATVTIGGGGAAATPKPSAAATASPAPSTGGAPTAAPTAASPTEAPTDAAGGAATPTPVFPSIGAADTPEPSGSVLGTVEEIPAEEVPGTDTAPLSGTGSRSTTTVILLLLAVAVVTALILLRLDPRRRQH